MKLITKKIQEKMPRIGENKNKNIEDLVFHLKLFTPWTYWTWYIAEANFDTGEMFGLCCGHEKELGYMDLNELMQLKHFSGLKVERDIFFESSNYKKVMEMEGV